MVRREAAPDQVIPRKGNPRGSMIAERKAAGPRARGSRATEGSAGADITTGDCYCCISSGLPQQAPPLNLDIFVLLVKVARKRADKVGEPTVVTTMAVCGPWNVDSRLATYWRKAVMTEIQVILSQLKQVKGDGHDKWSAL